MFVECYCFADLCQIFVPAMRRVLFLMVVVALITLVVVNARKQADRGLEMALERSMLYYIVYAYTVSE